MNPAELIISSRRRNPDPRTARAEREAEGGCGVVGVASNLPLAGRHIITSSERMRNRGNGKGGGIAAAGLDPGSLGIDAETLNTHYLIQAAILDPGARGEIEKGLEESCEIASMYMVPTLPDHREIEGLDIRPPDVIRAFVRPSDADLDRFIDEESLGDPDRLAAEDEFIYRMSRRLNRDLYAEGGMRAFILTQGKDLLVFKIVGYAEEAARYYLLDDFKAHTWIAHQRYPTRGRVWHPAGAHPFVGLHEALVHNGDFANYVGVTDYLRQRGTTPLFQTDTEVAALLFDLLSRVYRYPIEAVIEALAPTSELDFERLPDEKRRLYGNIQAVHLHGAPDGPWFFIITRSRPEEGECDLIGITDTSMLRPQVFAVARGKRDLGMVASEKQAIDAVLASIAAEEPGTPLSADRYWNARGGSHTDGGAFVFTVKRNGSGASLECGDKFGRSVPELRRTVTAASQEEIPPGAFLLDASGLPPEGEGSPARLLVEAYSRGERRIVVTNLQGQRFLGCGLGPDSAGVKIDLYGTPGDYAASGIDGAEIVIHGDAQDQVGQIMKSGRLIIHGSVGQAFLYGAKGGDVFVRGNVAGRALINACGRPRVVINGTALDYLAESFMAGDPLSGGGFIVLNGMTEEGGEWRELPLPYPGSNLLSLASGGAVYIRDPRRLLMEEQLNGGLIRPIEEEDWEIILPHLKENESTFGISIERDLLTCGGVRRHPGEIYRAVVPKGKIGE